MTAKTSPSAHVRDALVDVLRLDLVGPTNGDGDPHEVLPNAPSRWYLTGFLVPTDAPPEDREDPTALEEVDNGGDEGSDDEASPRESAAARRVFFPSSMGLSVLVPTEANLLRVRVSWGEYAPVASPACPGLKSGAGLTLKPSPSEGSPRDQQAGVDDSDDSASAKPSPREGLSVGPAPDFSPGKAAETPDTAGPSPDDRRAPDWKRTPHTASHDVLLEGGRTRRVALPDSRGLSLSISCREVKPDAEAHALVPPGTRAVSVFLVNERASAPDAHRDVGFVFQAQLTVSCDEPFVPRPDVRGRDADDWDEKVAELQYRDAFEWSVGHGVSTHATRVTGGDCYEVETTWVPDARVHRVIPSAAAGRGVTLSMEALASTPDASSLQRALSPLVSEYRAWIARQAAAVITPAHRRDVAEALLHRARAAADRVDAGVSALASPEVFRCFTAMNRAMAAAARQRSPERYADGKAPEWFPFQLAFILMNLRGLVEPEHPDRRMVDLLFFPTGGGKTEAYLGLAAFTLLYRRRTNEGVRGAGVSVLMRYTLRLLTLDQLGRAATLVCALELQRREDPGVWGSWPFEIGLWVGGAATPNEMGAKGDHRDDTARARTLSHQKDSKRFAPPVPLERCPWCNTALTPASFDLSPNKDQPRDLLLRCQQRPPRGAPRCPFSGESHLPVLAVDVSIYRRLPCFVIATVDKFANLPWVGRTGALFGLLDRYESDEPRGRYSAQGFYGPCDPGLGRTIPGGSLPPPDLIIQDELHLISGPLGTMVGLYETALEGLCARGSDPRPPKIVASTATVRRAEAQIRALFTRGAVEVFPPPGPDRGDSFFACVDPTDDRARRYLGVAAPGRSLKVVLLRVYLALLAAAQRMHDEAAVGLAQGARNPVDPYMTLLGYFSSLRELGGSRRIVEDEVATRLRGYADRKRRGDTRGPFAGRQIAVEPVELTSRVATDEVSKAKERLAHPATHPQKVDVALATNMISVGLDIVRLGLMVVLGQPKLAAEYIQATSRVGRDSAERPGLVVTLLNVHRPRDRSHYERFEAWHGAFYRAVEATSVTPWAPRALDRGLAPVVVSLARHRLSAMTPAAGAQSVIAQRAAVEAVTDAIAERAAQGTTLGQGEAERVRATTRARVADLIDAWEKLAKEGQASGALLQYQPGEVQGRSALLRQPLDPELVGASTERLKFKARRSLRDVEPSVQLAVRRLDGQLVED